MTAHVPLNTRVVDLDTPLFSGKVRARCGGGCRTAQRAQHRAAPQRTQCSLQHRGTAQHSAYVRRQRRRLRALCAPVSALLAPPRPQQALTAAQRPTPPSSSALTLYLSTCTAPRLRFSSACAACPAAALRAARAARCPAAAARSTLLCRAASSGSSLPRTCRPVRSSQRRRATPREQQLVILTSGISRLALIFSSVALAVLLAEGWNTRCAASSRHARVRFFKHTPAPSSTPGSCTLSFRAPPRCLHPPPRCLCKVSHGAGRCGAFGSVHWP